VTLRTPLKQKLQCGFKFGKRINPKHEWLRKRRNEWIQHSGAEFDRGTYEFSAVSLWAVKPMNARTGKEQDSWSIDDQLTNSRPADLQSSSLQNMEMTRVFTFLIHRTSAQNSRIEHPGCERKPFEEGRQSIH